MGGDNPFQIQRSVKETTKKQAEKLQRKALEKDLAHVQNTNPGEWLRPRPENTYKEAIKQISNTSEQWKDCIELLCKDVNDQLKKAEKELKGAEVNLLDARAKRFE